MLVAIAIPIFTSQLERSRDTTTISNVRAAYAQAQTAYLVQDSDSANKVTFTAGASGAATVTVGGVVSKGVQDNDFSNQTEDLVCATQFLAGQCDAMDNTPATYTLTFTYDANGAITAISAAAETTTP